MKLGTCQTKLNRKGNKNPNVLFQTVFDLAYVGMVYLEKNLISFLQILILKRFNSVVLSKIWQIHTEDSVCQQEGYQSCSPMNKMCIFCLQTIE